MPYRARDEGGVDVIFDIEQPVSLPDSGESESSQEDGASKAPVRCTTDSIWMKVNALHYSIVIY